MQSINFEFIRPHRPALADLGRYAEALLYIDPGSALIRMRAMAEALTKIIHKEECLPFLPNATFYDLVKHPAFAASVDRSLIHRINFLRVNGNDAAHGAQGDIRSASQGLEIAHQLVSYMGMRYHGLSREAIAPFQDVPDPTAQLNELKQSVAHYRSALESKAEEVDQLLDQLDQERARAAAEKTSESHQAQSRQQSHRVVDALQWNEAQTRRMMIDALLAQAGWSVNDKTQVTLEHPVEYQATGSGTGYADYVLWGGNGKPLAVVEAKRTSEEGLQKGREQARMYADGLERMTGQRPVIFYSNGYETFIWDDQLYNSYRPVYGFYSRDSLKYLLYQRHYRQPDLEQHNPDVNIAGRPYQIEAVKAVASRFQQQRRKALLVQATGTGKTRVAIAISELLTRSGWAKRILFLCDRKELRRQADDAFKTYLPSEPRCVIGERNQIDTEARIYVATYPGMMNRFHQLDVGFFDLIIADESHRSIYNKYRDLFEYFDALQIGLTATPVKFVARNTYDLFECEDQDPTFNFSLEDAVNNDPPYLAPFRVKDLTTEFLRDGIHYTELSDEQKRQLEEDLGEEKAEITSIAGKDIGKKIFSVETDRIILENLMQNGIKDATGSLVGKTIIFAQSQKHAEHLEKLFSKLYPQYGARVCKVIHNKIPRAEALIDEFKQADNDFRIAISVDMLDTGIDVPEVVNLVFAKPVRSLVKFWQMIGRGTRLCENLFGPGEHKSEFLIFDHYSNFTYFDEEYQEADEQQGKSLLQHLFETRLRLAQAALRQNHREAFDLATALIRQDLNDLPEKSIAVRRELRTVHELQQTDTIERMDADTQHRLAEVIAP
ncbi:type I site-specific restriction-modification system, R (restriction) subunit [Thiohalobacter thiocyanaticus]|uniref:Type I site-specific restriction-modification system, R (Restriction) subunit n=1 Tax=Thiohalobacter thiocyanaticus TaxID=585455 RepID=A0A1Z4VRB5_9GAMM|nr:DEAD/DEAH box helicase family protein [Thiohalobacter thiocyanaticus]BAZ93744.1 type I site-specific restriction-modification system, R (restriction) subunit [Thiohalobacter thiocyanaticus]